jgi:hypothetical protein
MRAVPNTTINRSKEALEFSGSISESSTAYSIIGKNRLDLAKIQTGNVELKIEPYERFFPIDFPGTLIQAKS